MPDFPNLHTSRLNLREIIEADANDLLRIHGDANHMAWFGTDPIADLDASKKVISTFASWRQLANPGTRWGLELKERPGLIGSCGLFAWNRGWKKCTLGYELAPEATGKGLMREALFEVLEWGFEHMELNRVEAQVHESNRPSIRLLECCGFAHEGRLREVAFWANRHHDLQQYSLLASDWAKLRGAA